MNGNDEAHEIPLAWTAVVADTPVRTADGTQVGTVGEVIGSVDDDIFHGIVVLVDTSAHEVLVPAADVSEITDRRIVITLSPDEVRALPAFSAPSSFELGVTGLLSRLGWVRERDDHI